MKDKTVKDAKDLRWVRIFTPIHIPRYLIEQIKEKDWKVDEFIKYHEINCLHEVEGQQVLNPFSHLYVLVNEENITKGFLWFTIEPLTKNIIIQNYSVDSDYWFKGRAVEKLADHVKYIQKKGKLGKIYWITNYPKHSEKYGFKQSKSILMEFSEDTDGKDSNRRSNTREKYLDVDTGTATISKQHIAGSGTASEPIVSAVLATI